MATPFPPAPARDAVRIGARAAAAGAAALYLFQPGPADAHHQNVVGASGGQCYGSYHRSPEEDFYILDNDVFDSDYCYITYTWYSAGGFERGGGRFNNPQDIGGWQLYGSSAPSQTSTVHWQVCKERQNDPDICSPVTITPK